MPRLTVDVEHLLVALVGEALETVAVLPAIDVDFGGPGGPQLPVVLLAPINGRMISNGHPHLGWEWTVAFTVLANGYNAASLLADDLYRAVHMLEGTSLAGVGEVATVEDEAMPARTSSVLLDAQNLTQFDGTFVVRVRPPRA